MYSNSSGCSWLSGQNGTNAALNIDNATNNYEYWPWFRQTNTYTSKWFSVGTINTSLCFIGSSTSRTANGYDYGFIMDFSNGNFSLQGNIYAAHFYENSDIRYKTILENKHYTSEDFSKLNVFTYSWKDSKEIQIGTSAQDVEQIIPELISEENEIKSLNYAKLGAIGVIELSKEIIKLKQHIKKLEERLNG